MIPESNDFGPKSGRQYPCGANVGPMGPMLAQLHFCLHYHDVIMCVTSSQITSILIVCSTICSGADQRKHQISTSLTFVSGNHQSLMDSPHKGPVTGKMFLFDDNIMCDAGAHFDKRCCKYIAKSKQVTGGFPAQRANNAKSVSMSWSQYDISSYMLFIKAK